MQRRRNRRRARCRSLRESGNPARAGEKPRVVSRPPLPTDPPGKGASDRTKVGPPRLRAVRIVGVDFTSAPSRRKAITVAHGTLDGVSVAVDRVDRLAHRPSFDALLATPGVRLAGIAAGDRSRVALEACPGLVMRAIACAGQAARDAARAAAGYGIPRAVDPVEGWIAGA